MKNYISVKVTRRLIGKIRKWNIVQKEKEKMNYGFYEYEESMETAMNYDFYIYQMRWFSVKLITTTQLI